MNTKERKLNITSIGINGESGATVVELDFLNY